MLIGPPKQGASARAVPTVAAVVPVPVPLPAPLRPVPLWGTRACRHGAYPGPCPCLARSIDCGCTPGHLTRPVDAASGAVRLPGWVAPGLRRWTLPPGGIVPPASTVPHESLCLPLWGGHPNPDGVVLSGAGGARALGAGPFPADRMTAGREPTSATIPLGPWAVNPVAGCFAKPLPAGCWHGGRGPLVGRGWAGGGPVVGWSRSVVRW